MESKITPILSVGKKIALSSNPASVVFSKLQQPKHTPIQEATASLPRRKGGSPCFFANKENIKDITDARAKAINRNIDFCSA